MFEFPAATDCANPPAKPAVPVRRFLTSTSGAVSSDFVVLTAFALMIAATIASSVGQGSSEASVRVGSNVQAAETMLDGAPYDNAGYYEAATASSFNEDAEFDISGGGSGGSSGGSGDGDVIINVGGGDGGDSGTTDTGGDPSTNTDPDGGTDSGSGDSGTADSGGSGGGGGGGSTDTGGCGPEPDPDAPPPVDPNPGDPSDPACL